jgi:tetratricopeptide (TPR) repeat protein
MTQIQPQNQRLVSPEEALILAKQHNESGNLQQAEMILRQILANQPQNADAHHLLGLVAYNAGKADIAVKYIAEAIKLASGNALFYANICEMLRQLKRTDESIATGEQGIKLSNAAPANFSNLGIAYYDTNQFDKAEQCHERALALNPNFAPSLNNLGSIRRKAKKYAEAEIYYRKAIAANPNNLEPKNNLAATLVQLSKPQEALEILGHVLARNPRYVEALCNKGCALNALGRELDALSAFYQTLELDPRYAQAYTGISRVKLDLSHDEKAVEMALKAIECDPKMAEAYSALGMAQLSQGDPEKARASLEKALDLDANLSSARLGLGNILLEEGHLKEAEEIFQSVIDENGADDMSALFNLAQARKNKTDDDLVKHLETKAQNINTLPGSKPMFLHFALGKVYDDIGEHEKSFAHYIEGCRLKRAKITYDANIKDTQIERIKNIFSKDYIDAMRGSGHSSKTPIFVLGMPRSGTTLTEQIIASHPDVFGAGELYDLMDLANWEGKTGPVVFPENIPTLHKVQIKEMGERYVAGLQERAPQSKRITDKMPANFFQIGLIHLILPNAKIIHVNRHPLDTCISCFTRLFAHNQDATYDLYELGRFYRGYHDIMNHWRRVLPKNSFYDIQYEKLVEDTETQAKALIKYCGLEWHESCLAFYENKRSIRTASVTQVRQPIYKSSLARWKKYEKFLGPLIEGLGDTPIPGLRD